MGPDLMDRVAGAPISWGVCEVPGWGHQLGPERVLREMRQVGLAATELGPDGFLPAAPPERAGLLAAHGLRAVGGFVPMVLHQPHRDPVAAIAPLLQSFAASGIATLVLAAGSGLDGYDQRARLSGEQWGTLLANLDRIRDAAAERGIAATLHPHVGTLVERLGEIARVLDGSSIPLCLDTGHLLVGGADPARLAAEVPARVGHAHLKDVDAALADRIRSGELTYRQAVAAGLYRPLGRGDVDIAGIVRSLEAAGYQGWYVIEQDTILVREPAPGDGPAAQVRASLAFLRGLGR
jgi:inosose dehydratase